MLFLSLIFLILIIFLFKKDNENEKLKKENEILRKKIDLISKVQSNNYQKTINISQDQNYITLDSIADNSKLNTSKETNTNISNKTKSYNVTNRNNMKHAKVVNEKERKNITILITGSICLVLSAIVFLMSTWTIIPNILKTIVLGLFTLIFLGGSYIAKYNFKLVKTSDTFFYIAMAYIPICFISISYLGLLGNYLSINGDGKYIYFMVVGIVISFIYYLTSKKYDNKYLLYGSILAQISSVATMSLIISNNIVLIGIDLLLYNILLIMLTQNNVFKKIYNILPIFSLLISFSHFFCNSILMIPLLIFACINYLILEILNPHKFYEYIFNIILIVLSTYIIKISSNTLALNIKYLLTLGLFVLIYIIENLVFYKNKNIINITSITTLISIGLLHILSLVCNLQVAPYIISLTQTIILIITYIRSKKIGKTICSILIPIYFICTGINILIVLKLSYHAYIIFAIITFILAELFRKTDTLIHISSHIISIILIVLTYLCVLTFEYTALSNDVFYALILCLIFSYCYLFDNKLIFKYLTYLSFNFFAKGSDIIFYTPIISTLIIMTIEYFSKSKQDKYINLYIGISQILSYIYIYLSPLGFTNNLAMFITIIYSIIIISYNYMTDIQLWNILPLTCAIPALFINNFSLDFQIGIMLLSTICVTTLSLIEKRISIYTIFSFLYLVFSFIKIDNSYLEKLMFCMWSFANLFCMQKEYEKDIFKFLSYLSILILYNTIIFDLNLNNCTLCLMLGYIITSLLVIKTIIIKYINNADIIEYVLFSLIYIIAIIFYKDELDGIVFGILLIAMTFLSYVKKYGAIFMVTIFAIIFNVFLLTRKFWFSIPWWLYLLTIGCVLIGFAIKNELNDRKSSTNAIKILKNIKDKIDN